MHEEAILEWVLDLNESEPDFIESVDRKTLQTLINDVEHLAVFFCKYLNIHIFITFNELLWSDTSFFNVK